MKEKIAKYWVIFYCVAFLITALIIAAVSEQNDFGIIALFDLMIFSGIMGISYFILLLHLNRKNKPNPNSKK